MSNNGNPHQPRIPAHEITRLMDSMMPTGALGEVFRDAQSETASHEGDGKDTVHNRSREAAAIAICRSGLTSCEVTLRTSVPPELASAHAGKHAMASSPTSGTGWQPPRSGTANMANKKPGRPCSVSGLQCSATGGDQASGRI